MYNEEHRHQRGKQQRKKFVDGRGFEEVSSIFSSNTSVDVIADTTPPTIAISASNITLGEGDTSIITFTLSLRSGTRKVSDFTSTTVYRHYGA